MNEENTSIRNEIKIARIYQISCSHVSDSVDSSSLQHNSHVNTTRGVFSNLLLSDVNPMSAYLIRVLGLNVIKAEVSHSASAPQPLQSTTSPKPDTSLSL